MNEYVLLEGKGLDTCYSATYMCQTPMLSTVIIEVRCSQTSSVVLKVKQEAGKLVCSVKF